MPLVSDRGRIASLGRALEQIFDVRVHIEKTFSIEHDDVCFIKLYHRRQYKAFCSKPTNACALFRDYCQALLPAHNTIKLWSRAEISEPAQLLREITIEHSRALLWFVVLGADVELPQLWNSCDSEGSKNVHWVANLRTKDGSISRYHGRSSNHPMRLPLRGKFLSLIRPRIASNEATRFSFSNSVTKASSILSISRPVVPFLTETSLVSSHHIRYDYRESPWASSERMASRKAARHRSGDAGGFSVILTGYSPSWDHSLGRFRVESCSSWNSQFRIRSRMGERSFRDRSGS